MDIIKPNKGLLDFNLKEIYRYKDLLKMFVKRDFITFYKQTILGPLWFFIQPIITTIIFVIIFGKLAGISTDGAPSTLFYLLGIIVWNYFADCLNNNSKVFLDNQGIFGKVYFPRIIKPLSIILSNLIKCSIQLLLFLLIFLFYVYYKDFQFVLSYRLLLFPFLILLTGFFGLGLGLIISSMTIKYRDLVFLLQFGIQMFMYATPVVYPLSSIPQKYQLFYSINPLTGIIEATRHIFLFSPIVFPWHSFLLTLLIIPMLLFFGFLAFNKTEKNFIDKV